MKESKRMIYAIFIAIIVVCGILYVILIGTDEQKKAMIVKADEVDVPQKNTTVEVVTLDIYVQICGAVKSEGIYSVPEGTRIFEIIKLAGGLTDAAATEVVNQARVAKDGEMILFPTKEEVISGTYAMEGTNALINLNLATKEQLMTLPGVGEAKALSIINYRETNNGFEGIEQIMKVDGIKESMFNKIKDLITV